MIDQVDGEKHHILVIDDSKVVRWQASKLLEQDYQVHLAEDGKQAWEMLQQNDQINLVFCDLQMPEMNGYQLLEQIRSSNDLRLINLPVVIITGDADDQETKSRCLESGATDFIPKPFDAVILKGRAAAYTGYHSRLSKLETQVEHDPLTGLASVQYFRRYGEQGLATALRYQTDMTIVLAELDHQDELIARLGKKVFAQVLARIGKQISPQLRGEDLIARVGLARYGVILPLTNRLGAARAVERIHACVRSLRLTFAGEALQLTVSVGVTSLERDHRTHFLELVRDAEVALKQARADGGDSITVFDQAPAAEEPVHQVAAEAAAPVAATVSPVARVVEPADVESQAAATTNEVPVPVATRTEPATATPPSAAPAVALPPLRELDGLLGQAQGDGIGKPLLRGLMRRLWPLIEYADQRLELGLTEPLARARQQLDKE